ncbi:MAG TPA: right-handed parallel beta-helix repeat-containing protein [Thermoanaerobaculia bacterium]|jgi:parallel beta-helix repeat protein
MRRILPLLLTLLLSSTATATIRYVATDGNDTTGTGTITAPYASITKAALVVQPGDIVYVRGGVYYQQANIWTDGTATARVTYQAYPGELPIIDAVGQVDASNNPANAVTLGGDYLDFIGFEIRNAPQIGIVGWGCHHVRVMNNTVHNSVRNGIWFGHDNFGRNYDNLITGNVIYNNVLENQARSWPNGGWATALGVFRAERVTVSHNIVYRNYGEGIILGCDDCKAIGNEAFDNFSANIYISHTQSSVVDGNLLYSTGDTNYYRNNHPAIGIGLANEDAPAAEVNPLNGNDITNNVIVRAMWGIGFWKDSEELDAHSMTNVRFANNVIYNATLDAVHFDPDTNHSGVLVENNSFHVMTTTAQLADVPTTAGITYRNNNWSANPGAPAYSSTTDVIGTAGFVRAGGLNAEDYKLTSTSALRGVGRTLTYGTKDYWLKSRSGTWDIGVHEY